MNRRYQLLLVFLLHTGVAVADGEPSRSLTLSATPPVVPVSRHAPGRYFVSLPTLEYSFEIGTQCAGEAKPQSLSINVADSRHTLSVPELEGNGAYQVLLAVPARQLAPIAIDNFCVYDMNDALSIVEPELATAPIGEPGRITIGAALSAHVSLLCSDDSTEQITYLTRPLDVTLACDVATLPGNTTDPPASNGR